MYSVFVIGLTRCYDFDVATETIAVCADKRSAIKYIEAEKARFLERCGRAWNDDFYYEGKLSYREHYLHTNGERP